MVKQTITVTNKEEHQYLDEYLASKVIGTRALSSVMIEEADAGSGIEVETHNISFNLIAYKPCGNAEKQKQGKIKAAEKD